MLYVYGLTDSTREPEVAGLHGAPVCAFGSQPPFAIASEHRDLPAHPDEVDLWTHERVVEGLMNGSTVLPMRFGSTVADEASLLALLEERRPEFLSLIGRVRGAVELSVRAQVTAEREPTPSITTGGGGGAGGPGTTYLLRRHDAQQRADEAVARIHEPLARLARHSARKAGGLDPGAFKAAYLVDRERVEEFRARIDELTAEIEGARIVCTGPWPPYSFSAEGRQ